MRTRRRERESLLLLRGLTTDDEVDLEGLEDEEDDSEEEDGTFQFN